MTTKFIHLNLHTEYSIVDSIVRIDPLFSKCIEYNMPAVALTDQSNLFALIKFYKAAISFGIKPIIGVDIWLENEKNCSQPFKMGLLAQNQQGYRHILQLISRSFIEGQHLGIPIVKRAWLQQLASGLIALSGGKNGDVGQTLLADDLEQARNLLQFWQKIFPDRYYIELQRTGRAKEEEYLVKAFDQAVKLNIPVVATNAVCFLEPQDFEAHEARVCIHSGYTLNDPNRPHGYNEQQYLRSPAEMEKLFHDIPESLINSVEIAKRCSVQLVLGETFLPIFPIPADILNGNSSSEDEQTLINCKTRFMAQAEDSLEPKCTKDMTIETYFAKEAHLGLTRRLQTNFTTDTPNFVEIQEEYGTRLEYEIKVINQMGFASYFLIVADFISWSKKNGIPVGPGRGSGAGSLVAYTLGITDIDPIKHELLFERFLNPDRVSLPDFDIDFCMDGRDRVIAYVIERYGRDKVAQIITYGTMAARAVVRDVGRVLGYPYGYVDKIAKLIPFELGISLERALQEEDLLQKKYTEEDDTRTLIDLAMKLEGIVRNAGKHAGGVVIAPSALTDFTPLYCEANGEGVITQLDKDDVEAIGLVKFDFLGLRTLTIIDWTLKTINASRKSNGLEPIDINLIPLDDAATYKLLQDCKTTAIFQFESRLSRDLIKRFKPDCFSDIVALGAIIRPGVLQSGMLDELVDRKRGRSRITYLHPKLEPVLRSTYGVAIYQEQVMQMAQSLAGYSLGSADLLRRAMGKKKPEEMALQRAIFSAGAAKNSIDGHVANMIFDVMEKFAGYGFNKSHSTAYALISYQTAWLKTHYPSEFMAAVLSSDMDNTDKVVIFLNECRNLGLTIGLPDINSSNYQFTVGSGGGILYGLGAIKGVGHAAVEAILAARNTEGEFKNLFDLCKRVDTRKVNKKVVEALICAGALDKIGPNRASQLATLAVALDVAEQHHKQHMSGQIDLFSELIAEDEIPFEYVVTEEWSKTERLKREKSVLGFYLNGHPIEQFTSELSKFITLNISELTPEVGKIVLIAGFVRSLRLVNTKSGNRLAIITLEDMTASIDVVMFAESFTNSRECLLEDQLVIIEGEVVVDTFSDGYRVRATKAMSLDQARSVYTKGLMLKLDVTASTGEDMENLYDILREYRGGTCPVFITYINSQTNVKLVLGDEWKVWPKEELLAKLKNKFGESNSYFVY